MDIIDLHCDALWKLSHGKGAIRYADSPQLDTNKNRLREGNVKVQCFAIFVEPEIQTEQKFQAALDQVDLFYYEILRKNPEMKHLKAWDDFDTLQNGEIGAVLTLEGVDAIGNDIGKLRLLYELGVMSVGLTWNYANLAADGALEPRGGGLTEFGREVVRLNNDYNVLTDVSHLSERSFWDVLELADYPIASHSNAKALCQHPRNLSDEQAKALFAKGGLIHVVYHPSFLSESGTATFSDIIKHVDHFCSLGGEKQIGLGSDFDGIDVKVKGLEDASKTQRLINELLKHFSEEEVRGFAYQNFLNHRPNVKEK
ncbi:dipeptidase [Bacillus alveayuensis]|jgi:membrane dipeptidase|uniref:Membrane dipeptidase n=1 Tax=Aeribacillus alveayuensis TaxID=279215 RepID=A0ABT9VQ73_9BACI|nr:dipeptidase [Bacillus alveayuensis]MDQ0163138.1 membrane dipeptidase [Bacillus alveayuensis]